MQNTTNNMAISHLQGKDICAIIKASANAGVSELELGDFKIRFGTRTHAEVVGIQPTIEGTHSLPPQSGMIDDQVNNQNQSQETQIDLLQERAISDLASAQTLIDSPAQFENNLIDDMINERGRGNDTEERRRVRAVL